MDFVEGIELIFGIFTLFLALAGSYYNFVGISGGLAIHTAVLFIIMGISLITISTKRIT